MTSVKPFQFKNLPRYSRVQANCLQTISTYLSGRPFQKEFRTHICEILQEALKVPVKLSGVDIQPIEAAKIPSLLPTEGALCCSEQRPDRKSSLLILIPRSSLNPSTGCWAEMDKVKRFDAA